MNSNAPLVTFDQSVTWFEPCHGNVVVADGRVLRCTTCSKSRGLLPGEVADFIAKAIQTFGDLAEIHITRAGAHRRIRGEAAPAAHEHERNMNMRTDTIFPSKYYRAASLTKPVKAVIDRLEMQEMANGDEKPVLILEGDGPDVVLNKTNLRAIEAVLGNESNDWSGHEVEISAATVQFQGKPTPGICVTVPNPASTGAEEEEGSAGTHAGS